jgi:hypothetical protein
LIKIYEFFTIHEEETLDQPSPLDSLSGALDILETLSPLVQSHWWVESSCSLMAPLFHLGCEERLSDTIRATAHDLWLRYLEHLSPESMDTIMRKNLISLIHRIDVSFG